MVLLNKKDFVELEFTAKVKDGQVFDTNIKEKAKELGIEDVRPLWACIGEKMVLTGLDNALAGKEVGKEYEIELKPEEAFGKRNPNLVKTIPVSVFLEKQVNPVPGMFLNLDGLIVRISSVSGGRVLVDFNNPLAGKDVIYTFKIIKKVDDMTEKLKILSEFFVGTEKFELNDKKAIFSGLFQKKAFEALSKKAKELLDIDVEIKKEEIKKRKIDDDTVEVGKVKLSKA
jgi:FKBP-type peptidyl-prolyl cis-trans isomerase 2